MKNSKYFHYYMNYLFPFERWSKMNNKGFYRFSWNWNIVTPILRKNNKNRTDQMRKFSVEIYFSFQRRTFVSHTYSHIIKCVLRRYIFDCNDIGLYFESLWHLKNCLVIWGIRHCQVRSHQYEKRLHIY